MNEAVAGIEHGSDNHIASGTEVFRHVGYYTEDEILAAWRNAGVKLWQGQAPAAKHFLIAAITSKGQARKANFFKRK